MDAYTIIKALSNFGLYNELTAAKVVNEIFPDTIHIYFVVESFGGLFEIRLMNDRVICKKLSNTGNEFLDTQYDHPKVGTRCELKHPIIIATCFELVRRYWPREYEQYSDKVKISYDLEYFKKNVHTDIPLNDGTNYIDTFYLPIFALLGFAELGGSARICGVQIGIEYSYRDSKLELLPNGTTWAYMGRSLWCHLTSYKKMNVTYV